MRFIAFILSIFSISQAFAITEYDLANMLPDETLSSAAPITPYHGKLYFIGSIDQQEYKRAYNLYSFEHHTKKLTKIKHIAQVTGVIGEGDIEYPELSITIKIYSDRLFVINSSQETTQLAYYDDTNNVLVNIANQQALNKVVDSIPSDNALYILTADSSNYKSLYIYRNDRLVKSETSYFSENTRNIFQLFSHAEKLYLFSRTDNKIYRYDNGADNFIELYDFSTMGDAYIYSHTRLIHDGILYFSCESNEKGSSLCSLDLATNQMKLLASINQQIAFRAGLIFPQEYNDKIYFSSREVDSNKGKELFVYDPTTNKITLAADIIVSDEYRYTDSRPELLTVYGNQLYFTAINHYRNTQTGPLEVSGIHSYNSETDSVSFLEATSSHETPFFSLFVHDNKLFFQSYSTTLYSYEASLPPIVKQKSERVEIDEDNFPTQFALQLNAEDPNNDELSWQVLSKPNKGTATLSENQQGEINIHYVPELNYHGEDRFTVQVTDPDGNSDASEIIISIKPINDVPTGSLTLKGNTVVGNTLNTENDIQDADSLGQFNYSWFRDNKPIASETNNSYILKQEDFNQAIHAEISYTDSDGTTEVIKSNKTKVITALDSNSGGSLHTFFLLLLPLVFRRNNHYMARKA